MQGFLREHFESAVRDFSISIIGVLLTTVSLCKVWNDDLYMSL